jgi:primosomal protein N' (replication factor Y)
LGPAPAPIERIRGNFRYHLLLRAPSAEPAPLQNLLRAWFEKGAHKEMESQNVRLLLDVDPVSLL